jgi:hypothetical protein
MRYVCRTFGFPVLTLVRAEPLLETLWKRNQVREVGTRQTAPVHHAKARGGIERKTQRCAAQEVAIRACGPYRGDSRPFALLAPWYPRLFWPVFSSFAFFAFSSYRRSATARGFALG